MIFHLELGSTEINWDQLRSIEVNWIRWTKQYTQNLGRSFVADKVKFDNWLRIFWLFRFSISSFHVYFFCKFQLNIPYVTHNLCILCDIIYIWDQFPGHIWKANLGLAWIYPLLSIPNCKLQGYTIWHAFRGRHFQSILLACFRCVSKTQNYR